MTATAPRRLARNALLIFAGQLLQVLAGFIALPYLVHGLGTEAFGIFQIAWSVLGYFAIVDLGLGRATTRFVADAIGRADRRMAVTAVRTSVTLQLSLGIAGALLLVWLSPLLVERVLKVPLPLQSDARQVFRLLAVAVPVVLLSASFSGVLEAFQRFDLVNYVRIPSGIATYGLPLAALALGWGLRGVVASVLLVRILGLLSFWLLARKQLPPEPNAAAPDGLRRRMLRYGGWLTVSNLVSPLMVNLDRLVIGARLSLSAVGYYAAPFDMLSRLSVFPSSVVSTLFPAFSSLNAAGDQRLIASLVARSIKYLLLGMIPVVLVVAMIARPGLALWLGPEFSLRSTRPLQILAVAMVINAVAQVPSAVLQGLGRADLTAMLHVLELPGYALFLWWATVAWGLEGVALAWLLRVSLDALLLFVAIARLRVARLSLVFRDAVLPALLPLGIALVVALLTRANTSDGFLRYCAAAVGSSFLFVILAARLSLSSDERRALAKVLRHRA